MSLWRVLVVLAVLSFFPATALLHNFIAFSERSKTWECKAHLPRLYAAEVAFRAKHGRYATRLAELDFQLERANRYAYLLHPEGPLEQRTGRIEAGSAEDVGVGVDVAMLQPDRPLDEGPLRRAVMLPGIERGQEITVACGGDIDLDPGLDVWSISSVARRGPLGEEVAPGVLCHDLDDVEPVFWRKPRYSRGCQPITAPVASPAR